MLSQKIKHFAMWVYGFFIIIDGQGHQVQTWKSVVLPFEWASASGAICMPSCISRLEGQ